MKPKESLDPLNEIRHLTEALSGAFAEGINLGSRGEHIRRLGQSLKISIEKLRYELKNLGNDPHLDFIRSQLDKLDVAAIIAREYEIDIKNK